MEKKPDALALSVFFSVIAFFGILNFAVIKECEFAVSLVFMGASLFIIAALTEMVVPKEMMMRIILFTASLGLVSFGMLYSFAPHIIVLITMLFALGWEIQKSIKAGFPPSDDS